MTAATRLSWPALALTLGLLFPASAAEQRSSIPVRGPEVISAAPAGAPGPLSLPTPNAGLQSASELSPVEAALPSLPAAAVVSIAAAPQGESSAAAVLSDAESFARIISELSPENAGRVSGEQAKTLSGRLIPGEGSGASGDLDVVVPPANGISALARPLRRPSSLVVRSAEARRLEPPSTLQERLSDRIQLTRLWAQGLWFYCVTNIVNKWGDYYQDWKRREASGMTPSVSSPRDFFAHMRVMGQTGEFYILGFVAREDDAVIAEARESFVAYFDHPGIGERERAAFDAFLGRAVRYNAAKRATSKFRAIVRDNMLKASTLPSAEVAGFFDKLYIDAAAKASDFQTGAANAILARFREIVLEELRAEPAGAEGRILGVVLIGSFATGAATPTSDFDAEIVAEGGSHARAKDFSERVTKRWDDEGRQKTNPVAFHDGVLTRSRHLIRMVHDVVYLVISPDASLVRELEVRDGEPPSFTPSRTLTRKGILQRWLQYGAVYMTSLFTPAKSILKTGASRR